MTTGPKEQNPVKPLVAFAAVRRGDGEGGAMSAPARPWADMAPAERLEAVRRLRGEALSASVIAARLHTTRNAVLGLMRRAGLSTPGTTSHVMRRPKRDGSAAGGRTRSAQVHAGAVTLAPVGQSAGEDRQSAIGSRQLEEGVGRVRRAPPKSGVAASIIFPTADCPLPTAAGEAGPAGIPFAALDALFARCRRPLWDAPVPLDEKRWCGAPTVAGRSYCAACLARPLVQTAPGWLKRITGEAGA